MKAILGFKNLEEDEKENCPCGDELRAHLQEFHELFMGKLSLEELLAGEPGEGDESEQGKAGITLVINERDVAQL